MVDFRARSADPVGSFAWRGRRPEVFVFVKILQLLGGKFDLVEPNLRRFGVVFIDGGGKHRGVDREPFLIGEEFPRPVDRFALEVIAKAEVAEHFEEGVVERGATDVVDIARAQTLLTGRRASKIELASTEEMILELVHTRRRKENRGIPSRNENVARTTHASFRFKKSKILFANFVCR